MANNSKVTKREYFGMVIGIVEQSAAANKEDILTFLNREVELLNQKSARSKENKSQKAHEVIKETILEVLADMGKAVSVPELMADDRLKTFMEETKDGQVEVTMSNQKLTSMLKKLKDEGRVVRTEVKKKAYYALPSVEEEPVAE